MAAKRGRNRSPSPDPEGMFAGMVVFMVEIGVQRRRLQVFTSLSSTSFLNIFMIVASCFFLLYEWKIWKQKLVQMGAVIQEDRLTKKVTHLLAMNPQALLDKFDKERLSHFTGVSWVFHFSSSSSAFCTFCAT